VSDRRVDVVLHIGADKTGTTSIQQLLRRNRDALAGHSVLYPRSPGRVRHVELGLYARSDESVVQHRDWLRGDYPAPPVFRRRLRRRLHREVAASDSSTVVLSDEALCRMDAEAIGRLRGLFDDIAREVRVVVYLRRQDDHLVSRYQQAVKVGSVLPLRVWALRDLSSTYDYAACLATWQKSLEPSRIAARPFERDRFPSGSLEQDFLDTVGIGARATDLRPVDVRNESLGAEAVELLRILNLHQVEHLGLEPWQISNRDHVRRLRGEPPGPQLTLPDADLDRFMEQWSASNQRVARDVLGEEHLFREPRRRAGTTTDQVLDPARLDHYFALLDIPEQHHAAVRAVAEREPAAR
jgi:hypothetical protein